MSVSFVYVQQQIRTRPSRATFATITPNRRSNNNNSNAGKLQHTRCDDDDNNNIALQRSAIWRNCDLKHYSNVCV